MANVIVDALFEVFYKSKWKVRCYFPGAGCIFVSKPHNLDERHKSMNYWGEAERAPHGQCDCARIVYECMHVYIWYIGHAKYIMTSMALWT